MIRTFLYWSSTGAMDVGGEELLAVWKQQPETVLWADFFDNSAETERRILVDTFALHPMAIQDAQRDRHPPKLESFGDHVFILLKGFSGATVDFELDTIQMALFVGDRFLVTRHSGPSPSIDQLWAELKDGGSLLATGPDALALRLSRIVVDRYLMKLLSLEPRLEDIEAEIVADPRDSILAELIGYKTGLRKFRRVLLYHVQVFDRLVRHAPPQIRPGRVHEVQDVYEHQERANSLAALYYEVSSDLIEGYISLASHRLNNIIKILTIITAIFVPLSFLAGVYGMNFEYMPELKSQSGYFILLGMMAVIATFLLILFRKKRWL